MPYEDVYEMNHPHQLSLLPPPSAVRRLTVGLIVVAVVGVTLLIAGALLDYGPLYTAGGIWLGFGFGVYKTRQHVKRELEKVRTGVRP